MKVTGHKPTTKDKIIMEIVSMLNFLKKEANKTYTENGAAAYVSTNSDCLDLFATIGALRSASREEIINRFTKAYAEDADLAMKILFFARDLRGGLGERRVFKVILKVVLISGCSTQVFLMLKEDNLEPYKFMMSVLMRQRYERIAA